MNSQLKQSDFDVINEIFAMQSGYVLDFTNRSFQDFFTEELNIEISSGKYDADGTSKAKRLRFLLKTTTNQETIKILAALWKYKSRQTRRNKIPETNPDLILEFSELITRIGGEIPEIQKSTSFNTSPHYKKIDPQTCENLHEKLVKLSELSPVPRGFEFEKFLKIMFDAYGLSARSSFRIVGEQIDGSFELNSDIYLLEAKWTSKPIDASVLRAFNAKVEDKAVWARGLLISESGFSTDGLAAFGKGKRVICMDGLDLSEMLQKNIHFSDVISKKVRHAAETGNPFARIRELF